jgi:hypothetical protein
LVISIVDNSAENEVVDDKVSVEYKIIFVEVVSVSVATVLLIWDND